MSYTNGIVTPQQFPVASEAVAPLSTGRATKTEPILRPGLAQNGLANAPVDETSLSSAASLIASAMSGSDVRSDKVAALQQSFAAGTYNVPSSDVAAKVISALLN